MKLDLAPITHTMRRLALAVVCTVALLQPLAAADIVPPPVPSNIQVPAGDTAFLEGHAVGTQNYICLPSGASVAWTLVGPQATLFNDWDRQLITHFLSPNPDESDTPRATWQHSRDTGTVWAIATRLPRCVDASCRRSQRRRRAGFMPHGRQGCRGHVCAVRSGRQDRPDTPSDWPQAA